MGVRCWRQNRSSRPPRTAKSARRFELGGVCTSHVRVPAHRHGAPRAVRPSTSSGCAGDLSEHRGMLPEARALFDGAQRQQRDSEHLLMVLTEGSSAAAREALLPASGLRREQVAGTTVGALSTAFFCALRVERTTDGGRLAAGRLGPGPPAGPCGWRLSTSKMSPPDGLWGLWTSSGVRPKLADLVAPASLGHLRLRPPGGQTPAAGVRPRYLFGRTHSTARTSGPASHLDTTSSAKARLDRRRRAQEAAQDERTPAFPFRLRPYPGRWPSTWRTYATHGDADATDATAGARARRTPFRPGAVG